MKSFFKNRRFMYTQSKKLVMFSVILVVASMSFSFLLYNEPYFLSVYFTTVIIVALITLIIKFDLYARQVEALEAPDQSRTIPLWPLILAVALGLFLPFILMFFIDLVHLIVLFNGYVAGVNLPEIILYIYALKTGRLKS